MKKLFLVALLALGAINANAAILGAPFIPEIDSRFDAIEQGNFYKQNYPIGAADGHLAQQLAQATWNASTLNGSAVEGTVGQFDLGVSIPANAIITRTYLYSVLKPTTAASGTLGWYCANASNPEFKLQTAAATYAATGASPIEGIQTGTAANMSVIPAKCNVHAKVATGAMNGKVTLFINYVVHQ